jgi:hypothetical protein
MGYFGYRLGVTQSNNAADVSIAGYGAMNGIADAGFNAVTAFKLPPLDFSTLRPNTITNTTTNTSTENNINNRDGQVVIGGNATQPAIVPPVVVVPPVVPAP